MKSNFKPGDRVSIDLGRHREYDPCVGTIRCDHGCGNYCVEVLDLEGEPITGQGCDGLIAVPYRSPLTPEIIHDYSLRAPEEE